MKLSELYVKQNLIVQLLWGDNKIEFYSEVIENDSTGVYISPYMHNGSALEINVSPGRGVLCNIFTDNPINKQRISWKNIELTTVEKSDETLYQIKTNGFNLIAEHDDRRSDNRIIVHNKANVTDTASATSTEVIIHDISDAGISFFAPLTFEPQSPQLVISFVDILDGKEFKVSANCMIARTEKRAGNIFVGCKIVGENKDYMLYRFMLHLKDKNKFKAINNQEENATEE